jgi:hypothetical protein
VGSSVGIGALIMGVTLLSVFAVATTVISNQAEVALEVSDPDVIEQPDLTLSNLANTGTVTSIGFSSGTGYFPGDLVFSDVCDVIPTGSFTVTNEQFRFRFTAEIPNGVDPIGSYNDSGWVGAHPTTGDHFSFTDLTASASGSEELWIVWFAVNPDLGGGFGTTSDEAPPAASDPGVEGSIQVTIDEGMTAEQIRDATLSELQDQSPPIAITWNAVSTNQIEGIHNSFGPVANWNSFPNTGTAPLFSESTTPGGDINGATLDPPNNGGAGCASAPTVDACGICGGFGDEDFTAIMEWDYGFDITNEGGTSVKLSEIFSTINGGATEVLSSNNPFPGEYIFPGEIISITKDSNSPASLARVAISSHGMNVAVEV